MRPRQIAMPESIDDLNVENYEENHHYGKMYQSDMKAATASYDCLEFPGTT